MRARGRSRRRLVPYLLILPALAWLVVFFALPVANMVSVSLQEGTVEEGFRLTWRWQTYVEALGLSSPQIFRSLLFALIVTVATLVISYPMAYWIALRGGRRKSLFLLLLLLPFFTPFLIRTLSWRQVLADNGLFLGPLKSIGVLDDDFRVLATSFAVICGLMYNFLPFMALPLYVALERLDPSLLEAAEDLYSGKVQAFLHVTLPLSFPGVFAGSLLTFIPVVGDFINAELLGGINDTMVGNVIQREFLVNNDYPEGAAISFILMIAILVGVFVYARALGTEELTG